GQGNEPPLFYLRNAKISSVSPIGKEHLMVGLVGSDIKGYLWRGQGHPLEAMVGKPCDLGCRISNILKGSDGRFRRELVLEVVGVGGQKSTG
ncbi:MAG: hypothetical protein EBZ48_16645, partial [Proteobacteria bacterium]|nr:hypothetical protein [Pseudomonadota bacterium]